MRGVAFFTTLLLVFLLFKGCDRSRIAADAQSLQQQREAENALIPDIVPPLAAQAITAAAIKQAAKYPSAAFCGALGKAIRNPHDSEYKRAMIARAANEFATVLKFSSQSAIKKRSIQMGFKPCAVVAAWGRPERINKSGGNYGEHEQWVYPAAYLYFEDGVMTSYQIQN